MLPIRLPLSLKRAIDSELIYLDQEITYDIPEEKLIQIYRLLGPTCNQSHQERRYKDNYRGHPPLTQGDRVRTRIAIATAWKVIPLWEIACKETDTTFTEQDWKDAAEEQRKEKGYLERLSPETIETFCVYNDIPRRYVPSHLMQMTEIALAQTMKDIDAFTNQAGEWWQIYPRPEDCEREFFIKWTVQEALYEALAWEKYWQDPPAQHAVRAYAGIFDGERFHYTRQMEWDYPKRNEFWRWWLTEAIPAAWELEYKTQ